MSSINYSSERERRARLLMHRAFMWNSDNPSAWAAIEHHALDLASQGQPVSVQALLESVRHKVFVDRYGRDSRVNNSYCPIFARMLVAEYPALGKFVTLRHCIYDELMGGKNE